MSFFWNGYILKDFLFQSFDTKSVSGFIGICVAILSAGILYEAIFFWKKHLFKKFLLIRKELDRKHSIGFESVQSENDDVLEPGEGNPTNSLLRGGPPTEEGGGVTRRLSRRRARLINFQHAEFLYLLTSSILHSIYAFLGYTLMNAVMTFNVWVLVATCLGIGIGFFVFRTPNDDDDESKNKTPNIIEQQNDNDETDKTGPGPNPGDPPSPSVDRRDNNESPTSRGRLRREGSVRSHTSRESEKQVPAVAQVIVVGAQVHSSQQQSQSP